MRGGRLDNLISIVRPGAPQRQGRSRVDGADILVATVPCEYLPDQGSERFANTLAENVASAPAIFRCRREPALEAVDAGYVIVLLEEVEGAMIPIARFDVKSARPADRDPRHTLEFRAVKKAAPNG